MSDLRSESSGDEEFRGFARLAPCGPTGDDTECACGCDAYETYRCVGYYGDGQPHPCCRPPGQGVVDQGLEAQGESPHAPGLGQQELTDLG